MQQEKGKVTVLGYFPSSSDVERAKKALGRLGVEVLQVDRISRFGTSFDCERNSAIAGRAETLTGLTLYSENRNRFTETDSRVLRGADPSVYSLGGVDGDLAGGAAFLLTVVTEDKNVDDVVKIIKAEGGTV